MRKSALITNFFAPRKVPMRDFVSQHSDYPISVDDDDDDDVEDIYSRDTAYGLNSHQEANRSHSSPLLVEDIPLSQSSEPNLIGSDLTESTSGLTKDQDSRPPTVLPLFRKRLRRERPRLHRTALSTVLARETDFYKSAQLDLSNSYQLLKRWTLSHKISRRPQTFWLDGDNLTTENNFMASLSSRQTTVTCLQFESTGQVLASANDKNELSFFDFNEYRRMARIHEVAENMFDTREQNPISCHDSSLHKEGLEPALVFNTPKPVGSLHWNSLNEDTIAASFEEKRDICLYNVNMEAVGETFVPPSRITIKGNSVLGFVPSHHLLVAGSVEGIVNAWDVRQRQNLAWSFQPSKASKVTALLPLSPNRLLVGYANGLICDINLALGTKKTQAFAAFNSPVVRKEVVLPRLYERHGLIGQQGGIQAMVQDRNHPTRVAVLGTNGARFLLDTKSWSIQYFYECDESVRNAIKSDSGFHPNHRNCASFSADGSFLYSVRAGDERFLDIHDFDASLRPGIDKSSPAQKLIPASDEGLENANTDETLRMASIWGKSCSSGQSEGHLPPFSYELPRRVSALALHPDSDMLVVTQYRDPRTRVFGFV